MNLLPNEAQDLLMALREGFSERGARRTQVLVCPPFPYLTMALDLLKGLPGVGVGAQHCHHLASGAYTGEVSAAQLAALGCSHVLVGHSERRSLFGETDQGVRLKIDAALKAGLQPIVCVGERLKERQDGIHNQRVIQQLEATIGHLHSDTVKRCIVAYEPVWAIGTGLTATSKQAAEMHAAICQLLSAQWPKVGDQVPILYGGSCTAQTAPELFAQPNVSGGLIGGASIKAPEFLSIVNAAE